MSDKKTADHQQNDIGLIGICSEGNSSFQKGCSQAPGLIRKALYNGSANLTSETGVNIGKNGFFLDAGDIKIGPGKESYLSIENSIDELLKTVATPLILGGDHAISYPVIRAIKKKHGPISILHFDAHPDLYDELEGNIYSHACPFARVMEEGLATQLIQVGIRTMNSHQRKQADRFGVEVHEMKTFDAHTFLPKLAGPVYLSFDLDALDPAFAPGVSHFEPGGLTVREVISIIHKIKVPFVGADIVEYNPVNDLNGVTAMVCAKLLKEILSAILLNATKRKVFNMM